MSMRLDKFLANMGCGSRKDVRKLVKQGLVKIDGITVTDPETPVDEVNAEIELSGEKVNYKPYVYIMMNKPAGVLSATEDAGHKTVATDLIGDELSHYDLSPAGRLDIDSEGFLLLTNDGMFVHNLITPSKHVDKIYFVRVNGVAGDADVKAFEDGVTIDDGYRCLPAKLEITGKGPYSCECLVTIHEGKFHQVKRMFEARGMSVTYLRRVAIGGVRLDESLKPGEYREMTAEETDKLRR